MKNLKTQDIEFENDICFATIQCSINPVADFDWACQEIEECINTELLEACYNGNGDIQGHITKNCGDLVFNAKVIDFQRYNSPDHDTDQGFTYKDVT
jgi:hypothetical protein